MANKKKPSPNQKDEVSMFIGLEVYQKRCVETLNQMKQPVNRNNKTAMLTLEDNLKTILIEWYDNVEASVANGTMLSDPSGILTNNTIFSRNAKLQKDFPHYKVLIAILDKVIKEKGGQDMSKAPKSKDVVDTSVNISSLVEATAEKVQADAVTKEGVSELEATHQDTKSTVVDIEGVGAVEVKAPVLEVKTQEKSVPVKQSLAEAVSEVSNIPEPTPTVIHNTTAENFQELHLRNIENQLAIMNDVDSDDTEEYTKHKSVLKSLVRNWVDDFYKSALDVNNEKRVKEDKYGILDEKTIFSTPEYTTKYEFANLVDKFVSQVRSKYKKSVGETTVDNLAKTIIDAQDDSKKEISLRSESAPNEEVTLNKETGEVQVKKDNIIVHTAKVVWKGVTTVVNYIANKFKQAWNWIKSFLFGKGDRKVIQADDKEALEQARKDAENRASELKQAS